MTRKDYILIADCLRQARNNPNIPMEHFEWGKQAVDSAAKMLAVQLQNDNPAFNAAHFLAVVRGEKGLNSRPSRGGAK